MELVTGWRKASYSGTNGGNCVEVANRRNVLVRDSKDKDGAHLAVLPAQWRALTRRIQHGQ
jgi:hypothetical protein